MNGLFLAILMHIMCIATFAEKFTEGGKAELVFHYVVECDEYSLGHMTISVRIRNKPPFFLDGKIYKTGLSKSQQARFDVTQKCLDGKILEVKVNIVNVSREDVVDTYICHVARANGYANHQTKRLKLAVEFPLDKASCEMVPKFLDTGGIWDVIRCKAEGGMEMGWIECYQKGERVPPLTAPNQNTTTLIQDLWIRRNVPVFCCSSSYKLPRDKCNCTDFYLDPENGSRHISSIVNSDCLWQHGGDNTEKGVPNTYHTHSDCTESETNPHSVDPPEWYIGSCLIIQTIVQFFISLMMFYYFLVHRDRDRSK